MCQSSFNDASEMRSSTHFSSVTATLFSLNAKHISSNLRTISFQTGPSLKLSSFLPVASGMLQWSVVLIPNVKVASSRFKRSKNIQNAIWCSQSCPLV